MVEQIFQNTVVYSASVKQAHKKEKGQFFTSIDVARFMGDGYKPTSRCVKILDPGAGNGSLGAALVEHLVENKLCDVIDLTYIEDDLEVMPVLEQTVTIVRDYCKTNKVSCKIHIIRKNFILEDFKDKYDVIISNPPYKKIRKDSDESLKMKEYVHGQPNLYSLFMAKGMNLLEDGGMFIYITPRSWTSGAYFSVVRENLSDVLSFDRIHVFGNRDNSFSQEKVLQETMILFGTRKKQKANIEISISDDDKFNNLRTFKVKAKSIKAIGKEKYLLIPSSKEDAGLINEMASFTETFYSMGYIFKTGPVVEFRNKSFISNAKEPDSVPMYRALNISSDALVFPVKTAKAQYISAKAKKLMIKNENTVFIRRLSAKEDHRRIQSCVYHRSGKNPYISVENHVNYVARRDGMPLSKKEVEWIHSILSSEEYDTFFRLLNGSTQVNASELNYLPIRSMAT